jgi:hypothetical protein
VSAKTWHKHGDHSDVARFKAGRSGKDECLCGHPLADHGTALVGPDAMPVMVHPGDEVESDGSYLVVVSGGARYGDV